MATEISVSPMVPAERDMARRLIVVNFAQEPFAAGMFGTNSIDRFAGMAEEYRGWPHNPGARVLVARVHDEVVGVCLATVPGDCPLCDQVALTDGLHPVEAEFRATCAAAHRAADLPPHAHISTVATEPSLHGTGIGRVLMAAVVEDLANVAEAVTLECLTSRARFYEHIGFSAVSEFDDPGGPDLRAVLMRRAL